MRSTAILAGLAAVASAQTLTVTSTTAVTVTYCAPSMTNCPNNNNGWASWSNVPVQATTTPATPTTWNTWSTVSNPPSPAQWQNGPQPGQPGYWVYWYDGSNVLCSTPAWQPWTAPTPAPTNAWVQYSIQGQTQNIGYSWSNWNVVSTVVQVIYVYWYDQSNVLCSTTAGAQWNNNAPVPTNAWVQYTTQGAVQSVAYNWQNWNAPPVQATPVAGQSWSGVPAVPVAPTTAAGQSWSGVPAVPVAPTTAAGQSWSGVPVAPTAVPCPAYTATGAPTWFQWLPSAQSQAMASKWANGPPADWCYYSYSSVPSVATATVPAGGQWSAANVSPTSTAPWNNVAKFTGAANANTGSLALAGLAGLAAVIIA